jgi:hypothetical protein
VCQATKNKFKLQRGQPDQESFLVAVTLRRVSLCVFGCLLGTAVCIQNSLLNVFGGAISNPEWQIKLGQLIPFRWKIDRDPYPKLTELRFADHMQSRRDRSLPNQR